MKFTLPWLREHLDTDASLDEICAKLTALGIEVEGVTDPSAGLDAFSVAYVREARQHPNADRLRLCTVETKHGVFEVVCGAPNARTGMKAVFAPEGSVIPVSGEVLKRATIRGVESSGMLCSARELKLGEDHDGIIELPATAEVGAPAVSALGIEAPVIEIKLTPDRSDCFGVAGIARDLAAADLGLLKRRNFTPVPAVGEAGIGIRLDFPDRDAAACPLFVGRVIRGVRNGQSPAWLKARLEAIGLRPISALVDITNYVTFDLSRPLHVFDAAKVRGDLVLRFAHEGEKLEALDEKTYTLDPSMTVIADDSGAISLGGIMGGATTGVDESTQDVILEVALFDPLRTATTGRRLGIESDARQRFERGVDPALVIPGAEHATRLIMDLCGGEPGPLVVAGKVPAGPASIRFRNAQLPRLAGIALPPAEIEMILRSLGFDLEGGPDEWRVTPPTWRHDVTTEACIVEELARLHGFDQIPPVPVTRAEAVSRGVLTPTQRRRGQMRRAIAAAGFAEAVTWSFIPPDHARLFGAPEPVLVRNPLNAELSAMRPSLLPGLLAAAARNLTRSLDDGALFEIGSRFTGAMPGEQLMAAAGVRYGAIEPRDWSRPARRADAMDAKADALAAIAVAGIKGDHLRVTADAPAWYHPGRSGRLWQGPVLLAQFGELHPEVLRKLDIEVPVVAFELDLEQLPPAKAKAGKSRPPLQALPFPPVERDFAFVVDAGVAADELLKAVRAAERKLIRDVQLFDVYSGTGVPEGKKSLAVAVRLQSPERTLTEPEIEGVAQKIIASAAKNTGAVLRA
ncbi:MAG: phenylalanine--tRNA ligase subunit beta [Geminicoccaceae bacterium]